MAVLDHPTNGYASRVAGRTRLRPVDQLTDEQLALLVSAGDRDAFAAVYDRHYPALLRFCRGMLRSREDAEDAAQSAMLAALRALPERPPRVQLRAWLYRVARNEAVSVMRRRGASTPLEEAPEGAAPGAAEAAELRERVGELVGDLRSLPERQRTALLMREFSGVEYPEIAATLGMSEASAMQSVFEARSALTLCREGRQLDCGSVQQLISAGDRRSLRARQIRAHIRGCDGCRAMSSRGRGPLGLLLGLPGAGWFGSWVRSLRASVTHCGVRALTICDRVPAGSSSGMKGGLAGLVLIAMTGAGAHLLHGAPAAHRPPAPLTRVSPAPVHHRHRLVRAFSAAVAPRRTFAAHARPHAPRRHVVAARRPALEPSVVRAAGAERSVAPAAAPVTAAAPAPSSVPHPLPVAAASPAAVLPAVRVGLTLPHGQHHELAASASVGTTAAPVAAAAVSVTPQHVAADASIHLLGLTVKLGACAGGCPAQP